MRQLAASATSGQAVEALAEAEADFLVAEAEASAAVVPAEVGNKKGLKNEPFFLC